LAEAPARRDRQVGSRPGRCRLDGPPPAISAPSEGPSSPDRARAIQVPAARRDRRPRHKARARRQQVHRLRRDPAVAGAAPGPHRAFGRCTRSRRRISRSPTPPGYPGAATTPTWFSTAMPIEPHGGRRRVRGVATRHRTAIWITTDARSSSTDHGSTPTSFRAEVQPGQRDQCGAPPRAQRSPAARPHGPIRRRPPETCRRDRHHHPRPRPRYPAGHRRQLLPPGLRRATRM
jgi:hypothetical protein